jgi:hypothetical protein
MTLDDILEHGPCESGREQWVAMYGDLPLETEISLGDVARACGAQAAWWCLCACDLDVRRRAIEVVLRCAVDRAAAAAAAAPGETGELWAAEAAEAAAEWLAYRAAEAAAWSAATTSSVAAWSDAYDRELDQQVSDLMEAFPPILEVQHDNR